MKKKKMGSRGYSFVYESDDGTLFQKCTSCGLIMELCSENFWKQKTKKSGYRSRCKKCLGYKAKSQWDIVNKPSKEAQSKRMREWKERQPAGIYKITCVENGRVYIGETKCLPIRWISHKSALKCKNGKTNSLLQEDFNKYGEEAFEWTIIKELEKEDKEALLLEEARTIQRYLEDGIELYNAQLTTDQLKILTENNNIE